VALWSVTRFVNNSLTCLSAN